jgi:RimJ/RimL family protein N-acetyltransferase
MLPIETARLRIAPIEPPDATALQAITDDDRVANAIHFLHHPFTLADADALIRGGIHGVERFLGVKTKAGMLVGVVGRGPRGEAVEIGYWFGARFWRQGYASEAVGAVVAALRTEDADRPIIAECRRENEASWRLLERLSFRPSGGKGERPGRELLILSAALAP